MQMDGQGIDPARHQRLDHRVDRLGAARGDQGAVEQQRRHRRAGCPAAAQFVERRRTIVRPIEPGFQQRCGFPPVCRPQPGQCGAIGQQLPGILDAAMMQIKADPLAGFGIDSGQGDPVRILLLLQQHRQRHAARLADAMDLLQPIGPIAASADQADADEAGPFDHLLDIEVDRQRMFEAQQIGQPQAGRSRRPRRRCAGQAGEIGIRGRQHHQVAGRLFEIDGVLAVGDLARGGVEKMHYTSAIAASMAGRSRPLRPITTSAPRGASAPQGRSK